jgi:hypothetical protein
MGFERPVHDGVIEQAVAGPRPTPQRARHRKKVGCAPADVVRGCTHGEGSGHRPAAARTAEQIEAHAGAGQSLVHADMGRAQRTAAAGDEADGITADEANEAIVIRLVSRHDMMVERDGRLLSQIDVLEIVTWVSCNSTSVKPELGWISDAKVSTALGLKQVGSVYALWRATRRT